MKCAGCGHSMKSGKEGGYPVYERIGLVLHPIPSVYACRNCGKNGAVVVCTNAAGVRG